MKIERFSRAKNSLCGRVLRRILGDECGAVAMEYIVIALLVAAAVVGLVMVFGGNLRNMFDKTNQTLVQTNVGDIEKVGGQHRAEQSALETQNETAVKAGNMLGGDFQADHKQQKSAAGGEE